MKFAFCLNCRARNIKNIINNVVNYYFKEILGKSNKELLELGLNSHDLTNLVSEGKIRREARISVNIPSGIDDEQTLRLSGQGEAGINGGPSGDLFINIRVKEHEFFVRDGNDIYIELPVTFSQVALGCTMEVETLTGKVALKIPAGTQTGTKFKMAGRGIQNQTSGRTGNQYVTVKVITPTKLSGEQKDLFEKLSKTNETASSSIFEKFKKFFTKK